MPLYALPLPPNSAHPTSRTHLSSLLPTRKRKRDRSPSLSPSRSEKDFQDNDDSNPSTTAAVAGSTNPLSLSPAEIAQYRLAGLSLEEQIPGKGLGFPHRGLPSTPLSFSSTRSRSPNQSVKGKGKEKDDSRYGVEQDEEAGREKRRSDHTRTGLRTQHLAVLVALLQRCLQAGDLERAGRAWALLIRAQVGGQAVDIRGSGYWGIGAELLIRRSVAGRRGEDVEGGRERKGEGRWGTREGLDKAKDYYERLILQHPYKRQFHNAVTALDFWPAMVGCEIYGIQWEWKEALRDLDRRAGVKDSEESGEVSENSEQEERGIGGFDEGGRERRRQSREERFWQERDDIRQTALGASEKIALRLDELMNTPPYSDSLVLLRLRGMLALYIGDLSVPKKPVDDDDGGEDDESVERNRWQGIERSDTERRFLLHQRLAEHGRGQEKQAEERARAKKLFERIGDEGAIVGINLSRFEADEVYDVLYDAED